MFTNPKPRDPQRINDMLETIKELWELVPDWRLGQLISNATPLGDDQFYVEDTDLRKGLEDMLRIYKGAGTNVPRNQD